MKKSLLISLTVLVFQVAALAQSTPVLGVATSADGIPIHYSVTGNGHTPVMLVHGWTLDGSYWDRQVPSLISDYRVVTVDLGGHGKSGKGRSDWTMAAFGDDVVAVADELELNGVILVGHSMGGSVITEAAQKLGDRVKGVVYVDSFFDPDEEMPEEDERQVIAAFRSDFRKNVGAMTREFLFTPHSDSLMKEQISDHMASFDPEIGVSAIKNLFEADYWDEIKALDVPKAAINANKPPTNVPRMADHGIEVYILQGVGHFLMMEDPEAFNRTLHDVLEEMD